MFDKDEQDGPTAALPPGYAAGSGEGAMQAVWERAQTRIRDELGRAVFDSWLAGLQPVESGDERLVFRVSSTFVRDWIATHYGDCLLRSWNDSTGPEADGNGADAAGNRRGKAGNGSSGPDMRKRRLFLQVAPSHLRQGEDEAGGSADKSGFDAREAAEWDGGQESGSPLDERFVFENFVVGNSNTVAYAAARRVADEAHASSSFNPLFLYGGVGLGKTHLMHAIAWETRRRYPQRTCIYLSAEKFMYQFVRALRFKDTMAFKEQFRKVDILMVDDIQFIAGKESTQEEFFHTFNALIDQNHQIVISADRSPSDLHGIEERIRSRLGGGLVADIHPTDYELRLGILHMKMDEAVHRHNAPQIPREVLEFLAKHIVSNVREMEGALKRVLAYSNFSHRPASVASVQDILRDLLRANARKVTIDEIQRQVAEHYNIRISDMLSPSRARASTRPRQVAMYLAKELTTRSLPEIGRKFGGRDHTTVLHATRKVSQSLTQDPELQEDVELLRRRLSD